MPTYLQVTTIAGLMLDDLAARCTESDVKLKWTPALAEIICRSGFSPTFGARPLRRATRMACARILAKPSRVMTSVRAPHMSHAEREREAERRQLCLSL